MIGRPHEKSGPAGRQRDRERKMDMHPEGQCHFNGGAR